MRRPRLRPEGRAVRSRDRGSFRGVSHSLRPWALFGPAALLAGGLAVALIATSDHLEHPELTTALVLFVSWSFIVAGLIGWSRRPRNRTGMLMVAVGFGVLVGS